MANWTEEEKRKIWNKGAIILGQDSSIWRKDQCGAIIKWDMYGDRSEQTNYGWEIDHIKPDSNGGEDIVSNARPLQWYNNVSRSNGKTNMSYFRKINKPIWGMGTLYVTEWQKKSRRRSGEGMKSQIAHPKMLSSSIKTLKSEEK